MIKLLSHLSFVAITTPDVEASVDFYVNQVGLVEVDREDDRVYLRCWGDYYKYSVVVVKGDEPGLETMAWRTSSAEALEAAVEKIEGAGVTGEWFEGNGIGRAYRFTGPFGHHMTLHWDVTRHHDTEGDAASIYPDRPSRRSKVAGAPRQLDHVTIATSDVDAFVAWYVDVLGFRFMARTVLDEAPISVFSVLTTNEKSHDLGVVLDGSSRAGRVNHYAFWVDTREELLIAADLLGENGYPIEYGPSIHGIGEQNFLYYREPSSLRIELNTGGYRNYVPDWEANTWRPSQGS
ncbi:MAG: VOC family protein, partial [Microbacterium sp.]